MLDKVSPFLILWYLMEDCCCTGAGFCGVAGVTWELDGTAVEAVGMGGMVSKITVSEGRMVVKPFTPSQPMIRRAPL